jgi:glycosidase
MFGAPHWNDFSCPAGTGLRSLENHIPHLLRLGVNAVYLGPVFESTSHGYDTLDYYHVDRRLGNNTDLKYLVRVFQDNGIAVVLDAVLNHTGRHFFAFKDLQEKGSSSDCRSWYANIDFENRSPEGDPFTYEGWNGCYDLVKLNGNSRDVREYLFGAVRFWIEEFGIDGLRLDAADMLLPDFMDELSRFCKSLKSGFWLLGEVVHGDYRHWVHEGRLDSVTNYELYKSLWSSFNEKNFFELSWTLNRQSGQDGIYRHLHLYTFADNHDVNRAASILREPNHVFPLYGLLFTLPGIPSLYYGSEFGVRGERTENSDRPLRPVWDFPPENRPTVDAAALEKAITDFIRIRKDFSALRTGSFRQVHAAHEQFVFMREAAEGGSQRILVAVNAAEYESGIHIPWETLQSDRRCWKDLLTGEEFNCSGDGLHINVGSAWLRILM